MFEQSSRFPGVFESKRIVAELRIGGGEIDGGGAGHGFVRPFESGGVNIAGYLFGASIFEKTDTHTAQKKQVLKLVGHVAGLAGSGGGERQFVGCAFQVTPSGAGVGVFDGGIGFG